jgi:hypothetical protein
MADAIVFAFNGILTHKKRERKEGEERVSTM